jgi:hypothetical protein
MQTRYQNNIFQKPSVLVNSEIYLEKNGEKILGDLSPMEYDILNYLLAFAKRKLFFKFKNNTNIDEFKKIANDILFELKHKELYDVVGYKSIKNMTFIKKTLEKFSNIHIHTNITKRERVKSESFKLFTLLRYNNKKGVIEFKLNQKAMVPMVSLRPYGKYIFITFNLDIQKQLSTTPVKKLYEFLLDKAYLKTYEIEFEDLLKIMSVDYNNQTNKSFGKFNRNHFKKAIKEINEKTELNVEIIVEKFGKATYINFIIQKNNEKLQKNNEKLQKNNENNEKLQKNEIITESDIIELNKKKEKVQKEFKKVFEIEDEEIIDVEVIIDAEIIEDDNNEQTEIKNDTNNTNNDAHIEQSEPKNDTNNDTNNEKTSSEKNKKYQYERYYDEEMLRNERKYKYNINEELKRKQMRHAKSIYDIPELEKFWEDIQIRAISGNKLEEMKKKGYVVYDEYAWIEEDVKRNYKNYWAIVQLNEMLNKFLDKKSNYRQKLSLYLSHFFETDEFVYYDEKDYLIKFDNGKKITYSPYETYEIIEEMVEWVVEYYEKGENEDDDDK